MQQNCRRLIKSVNQPRINGLCLFERELDVCLARIGIDLGIINTPTFSSPQDGQNVNFKWDEKYDKFSLTQTLNSIIFAMMTIFQKKEDASIVTTVAISRLLTFIKAIASELSDKQEWTDAIARPPQQILEAIEKELIKEQQNKV